MTILLFALSIILTVLGQVLLKFAALHPRQRVAYLTVAYAIFVIAVINSFYLMKYVDLKTFTILNSLIYIAVLFGSALVFREKITLHKFIGTVIVLAGIVVFNL